MCIGVSSLWIPQINVLFYITAVQTVGPATLTQNERLKVAFQLNPSQSQLDLPACGAAASQTCSSPGSWEGLAWASFAGRVDGPKRFTSIRAYFGMLFSSLS